MQELKDVLERRINELQQIILEKEQSLRNVPNGTVHVFNSDKRTQFYFNDNGKRKYAKEDERDLVQQLCQKDYDQKILAKAIKELKELEKLYSNYDSMTCEFVYEKLNSARQNLIQPIWLPDGEFIHNWETVEYVGKSFVEDAPEFYTNKGERVRSKSEILIANALQKHQVPYRYEFPIKLKQYGIVHPDFTVLNIRKRKEMYWEHMGMLDEDGYRDDALDKITAYEKNGIFPGDKLILTLETLKSPMNSKIIEKIIDQYLK